MKSERRKERDRREEREIEMGWRDKDKEWKIKKLIEWEIGRVREKEGESKSRD